IAYRTAWRTLTGSRCELSWKSRFCQDGDSTRLIAESPLNDDHAEELICSMKLTWPARSSCAAVVSSGTTRNTTVLKCEPVQPPPSWGTLLRVPPHSGPLAHFCSVCGPVPASCRASSQPVSALPPPPACVS